MKDTIMVDTDIIVEYLKTGKGLLPTAYEKYKMVISSVNYIELLASKTFTDSDLEKEVLEFVEKYFEVLDVNQEISDLAGKLLRENDLTLSTAIIAASAVTNKVALLTESKDKYKGIENLEFVSL